MSESEMFGKLFAMVFFVGMVLIGLFVCAMTTDMYDEHKRKNKDN